MSENNKTADQELLDRLKTAITEYNKAEKVVTTAQAELVPKAKLVGQLLLEAKKLHPKAADFEAFLKRAGGLNRSRAYDCMRIAGGIKTDEEIKKETRERVRKHRAKKKLPQPTPAPKKLEAKPSVTPPDVTESTDDRPPAAEISIDQRRAEMADLDLSAEERATKASAQALAQFNVACRIWLPKITVEADRQKARLLVSELTSNKKAEAA